MTDDDDDLKLTFLQTKTKIFTIVLNTFIDYIYEIIYHIGSVKGVTTSSCLCRYTALTDRSGLCTPQRT